MPRHPELYRGLNQFTYALDRVSAEYVDKPDTNALIDAALRGLLSATDPYSAYIRPGHKWARGGPAELGIEVAKMNGAFEVVSAIDGTPGGRSGLQATDQIIQLNGAPIDGLTLEQVVEKMRGPVDTPITLTVSRRGIDDPFDVRLVREIINVEPVKMRDEGDIAYIRITAFNERTNDKLIRAVKNVERSIGDKLKGYIIDLRKNPGGLLEQAVLVSDDFLSAGTIALIKKRNPWRRQHANAHPGDITRGTSLVVLINGGSAGASEILAGALQDHRRATVIGTHSFGMGSAQSTIPLGAKGAIRLTTTRYYTPQAVQSTQVLSLRSSLKSCCPMTSMPKSRPAFPSKNPSPAMATLAALWTLYPMHRERMHNCSMPWGS